MTTYDNLINSQTNLINHRGLEGAQPLHDHEKSIKIYISWVQIFFFFTVIAFFTAFIFLLNDLHEFNFNRFNDIVYIYKPTRNLTIAGPAVPRNPAIMVGNAVAGLQGAAAPAPYWHNMSSTDPKLCVNAQRKTRAYPEDCKNNPQFNSIGAPGWNTYADLMMKEDCIYHGGLTSPTAHYKIINPANSTASFYLVFVQAHISNETPEHFHRRNLLSSWTLSRFRKQFGDKIEITLIEMFDRVPRNYFNESYINTIIEYANLEGKSRDFVPCNPSLRRYINYFILTIYYF